MSNEYSRPYVTLVDQDGNPVCVEHENGRYTLHVQDDGTQRTLGEILDVLRAILAHLEA